MKLSLPILAILTTASIVASRFASDTCDGTTLKCSSSKTAVAGEKAKVQLTLTTKGNDWINSIEVGIDFGNQLSYATSKVLPFKLTDPDSKTNTEISWSESLGSINRKKGAKFDVTFHVDPCAEPEQRISVYADVGCYLEVECPPIHLKHKKKYICDHTQTPTQAPTQKPTQVPTPVPPPSEDGFEDLPVCQDCTLALQDLAPEKFNNASLPIIFVLTGGNFSTEWSTYEGLTIEGVILPPKRYQVTPNTITGASPALNLGKNSIALVAYEELSLLPLYFDTTIWAGSITLTIQLINPDSTAFTQSSAVVKVTLGDDQDVTTTASTTNGFVVFDNLPPRTILLEGTATNNALGVDTFAPEIGVDSYFMTITMRSFNPPSNIPNNDFSLNSTAGWDFAPGTPLEIVPHQEVISGIGNVTAPLDGATINSINPSSNRAGGVGTRALLPKRKAQSISDNDVQLGTSGKGARSTSRTFTTEPGVTNVLLRYRFVTTEIPGGYFGSKFNDGFSVSIRSLKGGGLVSEQNTMNGLGIISFNSNGETAWRERSLVVDEDSGDTVQVEVVVSNVNDEKLDSYVIVDFIDTKTKDQVLPSLAYDPANGGLKLTWEVLGQNPLIKPNTIKVYYANGPTYNDITSDIIFSYTVPALSPAGQGGPVNVPSGSLSNAPTGTTYIIAATGPKLVGALLDVQLSYKDGNAKTSVNQPLKDLVKDGRRAAGLENGYITSTSRTEKEQADAMFKNCRYPGYPNYRCNTYGPPQGLYDPSGIAVIKVYQEMTQGLSDAEIDAIKADVLVAMTQEILKIRANNPTAFKHIANIGNVVDVALPSTDKQLQIFLSVVTPRSYRVFPEKDCTHIEITKLQYP